MKKLTFLTVLAALSLPLCHAQHFQDLFTKHWKTGAEFTLAVADAMPADGYSFKPNDEEMSFGVLMAHIAMANNNAFSMVTGVKAPATPDAVVTAYKTKGNLSKEAAMKFLKESFDYCAGALAQLTDDQVGALKGPEGRQMSGAERLWAYFTHTAHHRGQAEVYLRVKNIKPPNYRF
jgi:uncharacterized damage-inducible protein DinB